MASIDFRLITSASLVPEWPKRKKISQFVMVIICNLKMELKLNNHDNA